jgi:hypothetical protein
MRVHKQFRFSWRNFGGKTFIEKTGAVFAAPARLVHPIPLV